jgi:hypothetical protein
MSLGDYRCRGMRLALPLVLLLLTAFAGSLIEGAPAHLPGVALGSSVLLHVERAAALLAVVVAILSVPAQAARGRLPTQLSTAGLAYDADVTEAVESAVEHLQVQVDSLHASLDRLIPLLGDDVSKE